MVLLIGLLLVTAGVALLFLGEVSLGRGKSLPALRSRFIGAICLVFFPGAIAAQILIPRYRADPGYWPAITTWSLLALCLISIFMLAYGPLFAKRRRPRVEAADALEPEPFMMEVELPEPEVELPDPIDEPAPRKAAPRPPARKARPAREENNPFDFS